MMVVSSAIAPRLLILWNILLPEVKRVAEVLAAVDAMRIAAGNPDPVGEYGTEAESIFQRVRSAQSDGRGIDQPQMSAIVEDVFRRWFGEDIPTVDVEEIARRLIELRLT